MGQSTEDFHLNNTNMKMFVVLALAALAAAEPEADPQLLLGGIHGVHTPYTHVAPVSTYSSPLLRTLVNPVQSIIPAVRTVVPEVKTVLSTPVVSTYSQYPYGVGYPMTYGAHPYGVIAAPTKTLSTTPLKPLPLERLWGNLLMLPRMEKLSMKFRRERLKLTPLFSTLDSPTPPPYTTLVWSTPSTMLAQLSAPSAMPALWSTPSTITMVSQLSTTDPHLSVVTLLSPT